MESWLSCPRNIQWTLLTSAADKCEHAPINTQWTGICASLRKLEAVESQRFLTEDVKRNLPSPVTLTLAPVLMVPNEFLASQMYRPSSPSQTPAVLSRQTRTNEQSVSELGSMSLLTTNNISTRWIQLLNPLLITNGINDSATVIRR